MDMKDRRQLAAWLNGRATLAEVESADPVGLVGNVRFSERARDWFRFLHTWSAHRFASLAQDRVYARAGMAGIDRRIRRALRLIETLKK